MELKTHQIISLYKAMDKLKDENVSLKTAVMIAKNVQALTTPVEIIDKKQRELLDKYAKKDENGNIIQGDNDTVQIESANEYFTQLQDILNTDIDVELKKIKIDDLGDIKLSANDILALDPILEDDEESKAE